MTRYGYWVATSSKTRSAGTGHIDPQRTAAQDSTINNVSISAGVTVCILQTNLP